MLLPVLFPILGMRLSPLLLAGTHVFGVCRVIADSFAVVVTPPLSLTVGLAADTLLRSVDGRLEDLLAVAATPAQLHARLLFSLDVCL
jgi:hypothetical protein